jgi:hypothetical protein
MDEFEKIKTVKRIADALEAIAAELKEMNHEGITVWGGSTMEEN